MKNKLFNSVAALGFVLGVGGAASAEDFESNADFLNTVKEAGFLETTSSVRQGMLQSSFLKVLRPTLQLQGHYDFCKINVCPVYKNPYSVINMTDERFQAADYVNKYVNASIRPESDMVAHGVEEQWDRWDEKDLDPNNTVPGDCEDNVLTKTKMLIARGFDESALTIVFVEKKNESKKGYEGHAVLAIRTNLGDYILDSLRNDIMSLDETPYKITKRQSRYDASKWEDVEISSIPDLEFGPIPLFNPQRVTTLVPQN